MKFVRTILFIFILIILIGGATKFTESDLLVFSLFSISFGLFLFSKAKFDIIILLPLAIFIVINIFSIIVYGFELSIRAYIGYNLRLLTIYFFVKLYKYDFFILYKKYFFYLAVISIPFYLVQLIDIHFFMSQFPQFNMSGDLRASVNRWNFFVYTAQEATTWGMPRNSGFGIEPGHYGFLLGVYVLIDLFDNKLKLSAKSYIVLLIGITTLSTTYFIFIISIIILVLIQRTRKKNISILMYLIYLLLIYAVIESDIINDKVQNTADIHLNLSQYNYNVGFDGAVLDRFSMMRVGMENFFANPFGHGLNTAGLAKNSFGSVLVGPNTLIWLISEWGILFLVFYPLFLRRFFNSYGVRIDNLTQIVLLIIFSSWLFSASIQNKDFLFFYIIMYSFIYAQSDLTRYKQLS